MEWWNGGSTDIADAKLPLRFGTANTPVPKSWPIEARSSGHANFDRMPLQAVLAWMAGVGERRRHLGRAASARRAPSVKNPNFVGQRRPLGRPRRPCGASGRPSRTCHRSGDLRRRRLRHLRAQSHRHQAATATKSTAESASEKLRLNKMDFDGRTRMPSRFARRAPSSRASKAGTARMRAEFQDEGARRRRAASSKLVIDIPESTATPQDLAHLTPKSSSSESPTSR